VRLRSRFDDGFHGDSLPLFFLVLQLGSVAVMVLVSIDAGACRPAAACVQVAAQRPPSIRQRTRSIAALLSPAGGGTGRRRLLFRRFKPILARSCSIKDLGP